MQWRLVLFGGAFRCSVHRPRLSVRVPIGQTSNVQASPKSWESLLCVRLASLQTGRTRTNRNPSRTLSKTDTASQETKKTNMGRVQAKSQGLNTTTGRNQILRL